MYQTNIAWVLPSRCKETNNIVQCVFLPFQCTAVEKAAWPLTESSHAAQLLRVLGNDGVPAVASLYYDILVLMPWMNRASSGADARVGA